MEHSHTGLPHTRTPRVAPPKSVCCQQGLRPWMPGARDRAQGPLRRSCLILGSSSRPSWDVPGLLLGHLAPSWDDGDRVRHPLAFSWGCLGAILCHLGPILRASGGHLGPSCAMLGPSWGHLEAICGPSGRFTRQAQNWWSCEAPACCLLGLSWGHLVPSWAHLEGIWCWC